MRWRGRKEGRGGPRGGGGEEGGLHAVVEETRMAAGAGPGGLSAVKFIGKGHRRHLDAGALLRCHLPQSSVERLRPEKERAVQHRTLDLAPEHAGLDQSEKRFEHHFADAIKTGCERRGFRHCAARREPRRDLAKPRVVAVTQDQALRQRVADLADADLQSAAVLD